MNQTPHYDRLKKIQKLKPRQDIKVFMFSQNKITVTLENCMDNKIKIFMVILLLKSENLSELAY